MKILLVTQTYKDSFPPRGLSMASAVKQSQAFSQIHQVTVLTSGRPAGFEQPNPNLKIISVNGFLLPDPINYVVSFQLLIKFIQLVREIRPDIVFVSKFMFFSSFVIPLARIMGQKVITSTDTFPGINWFPRSKAVGVVMWIYARVIGLPLLWLSNKVVLLYSGLKPIADRYRLNSVVIPNGVEESLLGDFSKPKDINKPKNEFWVGFIGRAESVKGYDIALKTADLLKHNPRVRFVFIGGNQKQTSSDNKLFLGFRSDVYNLYQLLDVLILPSFSEGLPNVVMEAMAQKTVVVANPVGGVNDLITPDVSGLFVSSNTPAEFAKKISYLFIHPQVTKKLQASAYQKITQYYAWSKIILSYANIFS